jgi:chorismate mutase
MGEKVYDPKREKEVLERLRLRLRSRNKRSLKERDVKKIFATVIRVCRQSQQ